MSIETGKSLGEIIHDDIREKNLNASTIARKMNISRQVINQISTRKRFDLDFLLKLKDASGLDYTSYAFDRVMENLLKEPEPSYPLNTNTIEVSLSLKINADQDNLGNLSALIETFKLEAGKYGFTLK